MTVRLVVPDTKFRLVLTGVKSLGPAVPEEMETLTVIVNAEGPLSGVVSTAGLPFSSALKLALLNATLGRLSSSVMVRVAVIGAANEALVA